MNWRQVMAAMRVSIVCICVSSCDQATQPGAVPEHSADVAIGWSLPKSADHCVSITRALLLVTAANMDTIREDIVITGPGVITTKLRVPAGKERTFHATLYQDTLAVLHGQETIDLKSGQRIELKMTLQFLVPALALSPIDSTVNKNDVFTVYIHAHRVDSLCTIGSKVTFDPGKLQVVDIGRDDDFLKTNGGAIVQLQFTRNNDAGEVKLVLGIFPAGTAVSGSGRIAHIVFKAIDGPSADLILSLDHSHDADLGLYDKSAHLMSAVALGGKITIK